MLALYRTLSLRYLRLRWALNTLVVVSIGLGVSVWVATSALYESLEQSILVSVNPMAGIADLQITNGDAGVPRELEKRLALVPGVKSVRPLVIESVHVVLPDKNEKNHNIRHPVLLFGMDPPKDEGADPSAAGVKLHYDFSAGFALLGRPPVLVGSGLDAVLPPGTTRFKVLAAGTTHEVVRAGTVEASGPLAGLGGNVLVMQCEPAAKLLDHPGRVSRMDVVFEPGSDPAEVTRAVNAELRGRGEGMAWTPEAQDNRFREALAPVKVGALIISTAALVVGMFLIFITLSVNVAERRHDIGVLRALGATRDQVRRLFQGEAVFLGLFGSLLGIPFGLLLARLLLGWLGRLIIESLGTAPMRMPSLADLWVPLTSAAIAGVATSVVASLVPALRAAREEPADAVRRVPQARAWWSWMAQLAACVLLATLGVGLIAGRDYLLSKRHAMFGGIGAVFVAAILAIALFSAVWARLLRPLAQRFFPIEGLLAADNLVRAPGRTGLVIAALAACVALMAHTAGIIRSNETAVVAWLDRALTADLVITSGGPVSATGQTTSMKEDVGRDIVKQFPKARVVPITWRFVEWPRDSEDIPVTVAAIDAATYYETSRERHPDLPHLALVRRLAEEPGTALISENFAALYHVSTGDVITVQAIGGPLSLRVLGAVEDYAAPRGLVLVHRDHYTRELNTQLVDIFDVYLPAGSDPATIERARDELAQSPLAAEHALVPLTGTEVRQHILEVIRKVYGLAYLQEIVVGIVAALGVVAALLISVIQRRRELGLLRAVGATRSQVLRTVVYEALLMGLIGSVLGILFGLLLEWYALRVIFLEESGFRFPMIPPWREAGIIAALAVTTATLASLLPALRAVRLRIADAIAYE
jgi:putative ABC transport system permease protein